MPPSPASAASASRPLDHPFVARYMARPLAVPERAATISARPGIASRAIASRGAGCRWRVWWWSWRFSFGWVVTGPSSRWQTGWPSSSRSRRRAGAVAGHDASRWAKWHLRHRSAPSAPRAARRDPAAGHADARVGRAAAIAGSSDYPCPLHHADVSMNAATRAEPASGSSCRGSGRPDGAAFGPARTAQPSPATVCNRS